MEEENKDKLDNKKNVKESVSIKQNKMAKLLHAN